MSTASLSISPYTDTLSIGTHTHKFTPSLSLLLLSVLVLLFPRWRLKGDAEQTEQPEGCTGPFCSSQCSGYQWQPTSATPSIPSQGHVGHWRVRGARGWGGQSHWGKWVTAVDLHGEAVESCCSLTIPVTDNNLRELWSLISTTLWLRQNAAP